MNKLSARALVLLGILVGFAAAVPTTYYLIYMPQVAKVKGEGPEDPLEAWSEASYIVWKYNSTHYASRNMSTLMVEGFSTDASAIINAILGNCSGGEKIFYKAGTYAISTEIYINNLDGITICGEGYGTVFDTEGNDIRCIRIYSSDGVTIENLRIEQNRTGTYGKDAIYSSYSDYGVLRNLWINEANRGAIRITIADSWTVDTVFIKDFGGVGGSGKGVAFDGVVTNSIMNNIIIEGTSNGDTGIYVGGDAAGASEDITVDNFYVEGCSYDGLSITGVNRVTISNGVSRNNTNEGLIFGTEYWTGNVSGHTVDNCRFVYNGRDGIEFYPSSGRWISDVSISNCFIALNGYCGVLINNDNCTDIEITGCTIRDNDVSDTATYDGVNSGGVNVLIHGNRIYDNDGYEVKITATGDTNQINDNDFTGNDRVGVISDAGTNTIWGYGNVITQPCENSGTAEASCDDYIAHGLAGTPDMVQLTVAEDNVRYICQWIGSNSTHFQIYLYDETAGAEENVDQTISWYAEYKP